MALLLDNDIVHKLAQLDLLPEATQLLKEEYGKIKVLNTLKFKLCPKQEKKRIKLGSLAVNRIKEFVKSGISEVNQEVIDIEFIEAMDSVSGLDSGEMQLLQALLNEKEQLLFTGDKRFLKALANTPTLQHKLIEIQNRFVCFEQIIFLLIKKLSFEIICKKYIEAKNNSQPVDLALRICFSSEPEKITESQFISTLLTHYIEPLQLETKNLLIPTPLLLTTS